MQAENDISQEKDGSGQFRDARVSQGEQYILWPDARSMQAVFDRLTGDELLQDEDEEINEFDLQAIVTILQQFTVEYTTYKYYGI